MTVFTYIFSLEGANGKKSTIRFASRDISGADIGAETLIANAEITDLAAKLDACVDAPVTATMQIGEIVAGGAGAGDVFEKAKLTLWLDAAGSKPWTHSLPSPSLDIFVGTSGPNRDVVNVSDADLVAYVAALASYVTVSDGETVNTTVQNGIGAGTRGANL